MIVSEGNTDILWINKMYNRARILIADDHNLIAELCKHLLEKDFDVVGVVSDGYALLRAAAELKPDVIVLDIAMPILNGLEAGRRIKKTLPTIKLVYLTMSPDADVAAEAFTAGASGYLLKTCASSEIVLAVRHALRGKTYLSQGISRDVIDSLHWQRNELVNADERLTDRQREVLQLLAEGKSMKEIGSVLRVSTRTVAYHKYRIMEILGTRNNSELVKYAVRNKIVAA